MSRWWIYSLTSTIYCSNYLITYSYDRNSLLQHMQNILQNSIDINLFRDIIYLLIRHIEKKIYCFCRQNFVTFCIYRVRHLLFICSPLIMFLINISNLKNNSDEKLSSKKKINEKQFIFFSFFHHKRYSK